MGALVVPFVNPNPIYKNGTNNNWPFTVTLTEKAGVAATLTGFTVAGNNDLSLFATTRIPAHGTISAAIVSTGLTVPVTRPFVFSGTDAAGKAWTQQLNIPFLDAQGTYFVPGMTLTTPLTSVQQDPQADASCQWAQPVTLQENGGFEITLTALTISGTSFTSQLQSIFGTQRLAPYGMLQGTVCFPAGTAIGTKAFTLTGTSELASTVTATLSIPLAAAASSPAALSASKASISFAAAVEGSVSDTLDLRFGGANPQWTVSVSPSNRTAKWLTVSPSSGGGDGQVSIQASAAGLSAGVYNAFVNIQAANSVPQAIRVPVTFVVGPTAVSRSQVCKTRSRS